MQFSPWDFSWEFLSESSVNGLRDCNISTLRAWCRIRDRGCFREKSSKKIDLAYRPDGAARWGSREQGAVKIPASYDDWRLPNRRKSDSEKIMTKLDFFCLVSEIISAVVVEVLGSYAEMFWKASLGYLLIISLGWASGRLTSTSDLSYVLCWIHLLYVDVDPKAPKSKLMYIDKQHMKKSETQSLRWPKISEYHIWCLSDDT